MTDLELNPDFVKWIQTPTGCEGGNIDGAIWFFGLEWGGDSHQTQTPDLVINHEHPYVSGDYREVFPDDYQYNNKLTKLYAAMLGQPTEHYARVFHETRMFDSGSDTYKGNIYTLSSPREDAQYFTSNLQQLTGCRSKEDYKQAHRDHRFPMLQRWVKEHQPQVIVCFGNSYVNDYRGAFTEQPISFETKRFAGVKLSFAPINDGNTLLVVLPFIAFYSHCLNSDHRIRHAGLQVSQLAQAQFGNEWCHHLDLVLPPIQRQEPQRLADKLGQEIRAMGRSVEEFAQSHSLPLAELDALLNRNGRLSKELAKALARATQTTTREWLAVQLEWECWWAEGDATCNPT
ncbi:hypothetical protein [Ferrimonas balearica]|uniref:hypothetical protein n=1 Tax=Ferrimonas balearica TaxID=44012 RepID=UPI001C9740ED|nr:hypothetical protein [Ferrimonas balearica]MBY5980215.1 hypothetical protein [Ferrimonas balearica]